MEGSDLDQDFGVWRNLWRLEKEEVDTLNASSLALCARSAGAGWYRHRTLSISLPFMANSHTATWSRGWWWRKQRSREVEVVRRAAEEMVERGRGGDGERQRAWSVHGDKGLSRVEAPSEPSLLLHCSSSASPRAPFTLHRGISQTACRLSLLTPPDALHIPAHSKCTTTLPLTHPTRSEAVQTHRGCCHSRPSIMKPSQQARPGESSLSFWSLEKSLEIGKTSR